MNLYNIFFYFLVFSFSISMARHSYAEEVTQPISSELCRLIVAHQPSDDVTFKAGVDQAGNAVAPADLQSSWFKLPKSLTVTIDQTLADIGQDEQGPVSKIDMSQLTFDMKTKRLVLAGQPIDPTVSADMIKKCRISTR